MRRPLIVDQWSVNSGASSSVWCLIRRGGEILTILVMLCVRGISTVSHTILVLRCDLEPVLHMGVASEWPQIQLLRPRSPGLLQEKQHRFGEIFRLQVLAAGFACLLLLFRERAVAKGSQD